MRLSAAQARRLAVRAQGLDRRRPDRVDVRHLRRVLDDVAVVQLDSVNVLARTHQLVFFSRLGAACDGAAVDAFLWRGREAVEAWAHVASVIPTAHWPLFGHRRDREQPGATLREILDGAPGYVEEVYAEVARRGPLTAPDLPEPGDRGGPWWGHRPGRRVLDWLFATGRVGVDHRDPRFWIHYDLIERVVPATVRACDEPPADVAYERLLTVAASAHGVGTAADLADYHRLPLRPARAAIERLVARGELLETEVEGWGRPGYLAPDTTVPRAVRARALLSPFDALVWRRERVERLFDFHYRIEIYVPEAQRRYGYYVLPFLLDDRLVARVDLKADRADRRLLVRGAFAEERVDPLLVARELAAELREMAAWLGLDTVACADRGDLAPPLRASLG